MTGWDILTTTDVLQQFNDSETTAYDTAKGDPGLVSLADILAKTVNQVRQAYADGGRLVDADSLLTVPDGEMNRVIAIARYKYLLSIPTGKSLAENRKEENDKAEDYFLLVAKRGIKFAGAAIGRPGRNINTCSFDKLGQT